jgi:hypothetical protein
MVSPQSVASVITQTPPPRAVFAHGQRWRAVGQLRQPHDANSIRTNSTLAAIQCPVAYNATIETIHMAAPVFIV